MTREERNGAALAGLILVALPIVAVLYGAGTPGPVHAITALLGIALLTAAAASSDR